MGAGKEMRAGWWPTRNLCSSSALVLRNVNGSACGAIVVNAVSAIRYIGGTSGVCKNTPAGHVISGPRITGHCAVRHKGETAIGSSYPVIAIVDVTVVD